MYTVPFFTAQVIVRFKDYMNILYYWTARLSFLTGAGTSLGSEIIGFYNNSKYICFAWNLVV